MKRTLVVILLGILALVMAYPALADDGDNGGGLDPALQWQLADNSWQKREYDDAAVLMSSFAEANPDNDNTLEALWRAYLIYHDYRPNALREKIALGKAEDACDRWEHKYAQSNKERASAAMWYSANIADHEGNRAEALSILSDLVKKYPGTAHEADADWTSAEWLRGQNRLKEAIPFYTAYMAIVKNTQEGGAVAGFRVGTAYADLGDVPDAIAAYKSVLDGGYNWGWGTMGWGSLDAARRLKALGDGDLAREFALKIIDKCPQNWLDVQTQARILLGDKNVKNIEIDPNIQDTYTCNYVSLDPNTKVTLSRAIPLLVRLGYVSKDTPFQATLTVIPKIPFVKDPDNMTKTEADGKTTYTANIVAPDKNGNVQGDWWYHFTEQDQKVSAPASLVVTRKWKKSGPGWGECTIRVQSSGRWHFWIYLPTATTNVNNLSIQPNEVNDGGKTFHWYDWYDLTQGMTIRFPVEVSPNTQEYYPKMRFERNTGRFGDKAGNDAAVSYDTPEYTIKLTSDKPFPSLFHFPVNQVVYLNEVIR